MYTFSQTIFISLVLKQEKNIVATSPVQNNIQDESKQQGTVLPNSLDSPSSSSSETNNTPQEQFASPQQRRTTQIGITTTPMHDILTIIEENRLPTLYENKNLHYFFLKNCVLNIVSRKKWKENITRYVYSRFVHPSDEGFALVVLENNVTRYREMRDRDNRIDGQDTEDRDDEQEYKYTQPLYTTVTKKGLKSTGKGWTDKGKLRFQHYTEFVRTKRQNQQWLNDRNNAIKRRALRDSKEWKKRKRSSDSDYGNEKRMNGSEESAWNKFIVDNVNDTEWLNNVVGV